VEKPQRSTVNAMSAGAHLAFGAGSGVAFALLQRQLRSRYASGAQGMAFALLIWLVSYKGWVPALRIMPSAEQDRPGRVMTMIAAHLVYGATLGDLTARWTHSPSLKEFKSPARDRAL
jgi:hypothetical protein